MPYSDQQIRDYALALGQKGASDGEIEEFVKSAKADSTQTGPAPATESSVIDAGKEVASEVVKDVGELGSQLNPRSIEELKANWSKISVDPKNLTPSAIGKAIRSMGIRGGATAIGQTIGSRGGTVGRSLGGMAGGAAGEVIADLVDNQPITAGKVTRAALSGAVPGKNLVGASEQTLAREAVKYGATEATASQAESLIDRGELDAGAAVQGAVGGVLGAGAGKLLAKPTALDPFEENFLLRNESLRELRKTGAKIKVNPQELGRAPGVTAMAGAVSIEKTAAMNNQTEFQKLIRSELGLPENDEKFRKAIVFGDQKSAPPTGQPKTLLDVRKKAYEPYQTVEKLHDEAVDEMRKLKSQFSNSQELEAALSTPQGKALAVYEAADVELLKETRAKAKLAFESTKTGTNPQAYQEWKDLKAKAESIENNIRNAADLSGDKTLLTRLQNARETIAKTHAVEEALGEDGLVNAIELGALQADGQPLTGNLKKIASFAQNFNKEAVEATKTRNRGGGKITGLISTAQASQGTVPGMAGAAASIMAGPVLRPILLSEFAQNYMLNSPRERQNFTQAFARYLAEDAIRKRQESAQPTGAK